MISQQELADKAGITRSSVAVHISNLMKKGYITGKGYIVHTAPYVTVVGGVNMDIGGWPGEVPVMQDSNPGVVRMSLGGVCYDSLCRYRKSVQDIRSLGSLQRKHVPTNGDGGRVFRSSSDELPASYDDLCKQKTFL